MQIALTKKLTDALELKLPAADESLNPLFSWTANWTTVWSNKRSEDMIVLVNNANRFVVAIYQVKKKDLKNLQVMIENAIVNTLRYFQVNPAIVQEYMRLAGDLEFVQNHSRQTAAWLNSAGLECCFYIGHNYNGTAKMYRDTVGATANYRTVNYSTKTGDSFFPFKRMFQDLTVLTGLPLYHYNAFELLVSLDLEEYKAERRIVVPADLTFARLHQVLQRVFSWKDCHLYDFELVDEQQRLPAVRLVPDKLCLEYGDKAVLMDEHTLNEYLPAYKQLLYTYDMGDNWIHDVRLIREIEDYDQESPALLEANGQTPPEDVGGVGGFLNFLAILRNPGDPDYDDMKRWAGYWSIELRDWQKSPRAIRE